MHSRSMLPLGLALVANSTAQAQQPAESIREDRRIRAFKLDIRPEYTSGKYGGASTIEESAVNFSAQYDTERFAFKLSMPYLRIRSDETVLVVEPGVIVCADRGGSNSGPAGGGGSGGNSGPGGGGGSGNNSGSGSNGDSGGGDDSGGNDGDDDAGGVVVVASAAARTCSTTPGSTTATRNKRTISGWGDLVGAVTYKVLPAAPDGWLLDLTGKIKFPTANRDKGLGTGKADYSVQADVSKSIGDFTPFFGLGYKWRGKADDIGLRNSAFGSVGAAYRVARDTELELAFDYRDKASAQSAAARDLTLTVYHRMSDLLRLNGFVSKGFSDASPDWGAGLGVSLRF